MSADRDLESLSGALDARSQLPPEVERRLVRDLRLARRAHALRQIDALLAAELGTRPPNAERSIAPRVLSRLRDRRAPRAVDAWIALAAAGAALVLAPLPRQPSATPPAPPVPNWVGSAERWLERQPIAPEETLVVEAWRLADDTRHVARSLWSSLPLATWVRAPAWIFDERR